MEMVFVRQTLILSGISTRRLIEMFACVEVWNKMTPLGEHLPRGSFFCARY